jgi:hypothetical protein
LTADAADRELGQIGVRPEDVQAGLQKTTATFGDPVGRLDAPIGPHLSHRINLDTAVAVRAIYLRTSVLTFAVRWVDDDQ